MSSIMKKLNSKQYMKHACVEKGPYCIKDGIPMLPLLEDGWGPVRQYMCGHCGLVIDTTGKRQH